jgi:hypothetical protein
MVLPISTAQEVGEETYQHPFRLLGTLGGHLAQSLERKDSTVPG